jgi:hypothetical protein
VSKAASLTPIEQALVTVLVSAVLNDLKNESPEKPNARGVRVAGASPIEVQTRERYRESYNSP